MSAAGNRSNGQSSKSGPPGRKPEPRPPSHRDNNRFRASGRPFSKHSEAIAKAASSSARVSALAGPAIRSAMGGAFCCNQRRMRSRATSAASASSKEVGILRFGIVRIIEIPNFEFADRITKKAQLPAARGRGLPTDHTILLAGVAGQLQPLAIRRSQVSADIFHASPACPLPSCVQHVSSRQGDISSETHNLCSPRRNLLGRLRATTVGFVCHSTPSRHTLDIEYQQWLPSADNIQV